MRVQKRFESTVRPASERAAELLEVAEKLSRFNRPSWKEALGKIASPAFRLHRYRDAHNRLLHDALREKDCADTRNRGA